MAQYFGLAMLSTKLFHLFQTITFKQSTIIYQTHKISTVGKTLAIKTYTILM